MRDCNIFDIFNSFSISGFQYLGGKQYTNVCFIALSDDGTVYGAGDALPGSAITPDELSDGTKFYGLYWQADGLIYAKFGDAGDEQVYDVNSIIVTSLDEETVVLSWDATNNYYSTVNQAVTDKLIADYTDDGVLEDMCFGIYPMVSKVILYNNFQPCRCDTCMLPDFAIYYDDYTVNCWSKK